MSYVNKLKRNPVVHFIFKVKGNVSQLEFDALYTDLTKSKRKFNLAFYDIQSLNYMNSF